MKFIEDEIVILNKDNVDTDQIIPAKFLTVTDKNGLAKYLFSYWRYDNNDKLNPDFCLNRYPESKILISAINFGCGSSREHAPWALKDYGFKAVICGSAAEIFKNNSFKNTLPIIELGDDIHKLLAKEDSKKLSIDFEKEEILIDELKLSFKLNEFQKYCILNDINEFDFLLKHSEKITKYEEEHQA